MAIYRSPLNPANISGWKAQFHDSKRNAKEKILSVFCTKLSLDSTNYLMTKMKVLTVQQLQILNPSLYILLMILYNFGFSCRRRRERAIQFMGNNLRQSNYEDEG